MLDIIAVCLVLTAGLAYVNLRFIGLPVTIGVMMTALVLSLSIVALDAAGIDFGLLQYEKSLLRAIDFSDVLMQGMLSLLLFAGAMHVDLSELRAYRWQIGALAVIGTILSTLAVGFGTWMVMPWVGVERRSASSTTLAARVGSCCRRRHRVCYRDVVPVGGFTGVSGVQVMRCT